MTDNGTGDLWFAYDGDCPVCGYAAHALRIRRDVGTLHLVDARTEPDHPVIREINARHIDLDTGMVLKFRDVLYHGQDALHMMGLLGSPKGWFNRANALLFRHRILARCFYPPMRAARNMLLRIKGVGKLNNLCNANTAQKPIFETVFGESWAALPGVMQKHYSIRPFSKDTVVVEGLLDIHISQWLKPLLRLSGLMISQSGKDIPVTVIFRGSAEDDSFYFDRTFRFANRDQHFVSRMETLGGNGVIEFVGLGLGWKTAFVAEGDKIELQYRGYVWRILGLTIPVPLSLLMGKGWAEEEAISENTFRMKTHVRHFLFGNVFAYNGEFTVVSKSDTEAALSAQDTPDGAGNGE